MTAPKRHSVTGPPPTEAVAAATIPYPLAMDPHEAAETVLAAWNDGLCNDTSDLWRATVTAAHAIVLAHAYRDDSAALGVVMAERNEALVQADTLTAERDQAVAALRDAQAVVARDALDVQQAHAALRAVEADAERILSLAWAASKTDADDQAIQRVRAALASSPPVPPTPAEPCEVHDFRDVISERRCWTCDAPQPEPRRRPPAAQEPVTLLSHEEAAEIRRRIFPAALPAPEPLPTDCPHGDPTCPCPDGLVCHYVEADGTPPFPEPLLTDQGHWNRPGRCTPLCGCPEGGTCRLALRTEVGPLPSTGTDGDQP